MYIETSTNKLGEKAWLVSEHLLPSESTTGGDYCVEFYYHMYLYFFLSINVIL
jgi:hypothetical protein